MTGRRSGPSRGAGCPNSSAARRSRISCAGSSITTKAASATPGPFSEGSRDGDGRKRIALGSGFIVDPSGIVVTNNHVVGKSSKVEVVLQDNSKYPARVLGRDPRTDIAVLKIKADKPLPYVAFGDSSAAQVGDWVIAVGNPFGLGGSVTTGIISARGRDIHSGQFDDYLQIDAPINRGNSGGPTFNSNGEVIGINTAIYSPNGGSVGIGFAVPSNVAKHRRRADREATARSAAAGSACRSRRSRRRSRPASALAATAARWSPMSRRTARRPAPA